MHIFVNMISPTFLGSTLCRSEQEQSSLIVLMYYLLVTHARIFGWTNEEKYLVMMPYALL